MYRYAGGYQVLSTVLPGARIETSHGDHCTGIIVDLARMTFIYLLDVYMHNGQRLFNQIRRVSALLVDASSRMSQSSDHKWHLK